MHLDEFFKDHSKVAFLATVEPFGDKVRVTPWRPSGGCRCHAALLVPKSTIASVEPTNDVEYCCGKALRVAKVEFGAPSAFLEDIFGQILERPPGGGGGPPSCAAQCGDIRQGCLNECFGDPDCEARCESAYKTCRNSCH
jgi:hypothetical protein